ncbi:MAG: hypothetical protein ACJASM_002044 [Salibacteraceae bacterium]|jgi:hypothetical protein
MSSIVKNELRVGNFTSSAVHQLIKKGRSADFSAPGISYIQKKFYERKLGRSLDMGGGGKSANWGLFLEQYVYTYVAGLSYQIAATETSPNPNVSYHAGSTDLLAPKELVGDIKCYEPLKFCRMAECMKKGDRLLFSEEFPAEYWQLVSNAVIHDVPEAESILFMPNLIELEEIKEMAANYDGSDQWKYRFIYESKNYELAHVPDDSGYESINKFRFEVPQEDKDFLMQRLAMAEKELQLLFTKSIN